jgi:class 3 adenylate cyclase/CHASE2 domain-containing sensor protein
VIVAAVASLVALVLAIEEGFGFAGMLRRLEWITFDWRARQAVLRPLPASTNLGFVFISDESIEALKNGTLDYKVGLYWPRHVYGRLVRELAAQNAESIAFDILFPDLRPDHPMVDLRSGRETSDAFFAREMGLAGNVILAAEKGIVPPELFRTNAWAAGDISSRKDADGVLRRARAFETYYIWHPLIKRAAVRYGFDLRQPLIEEKRISFAIPGGPLRREFALDQDGNFDWVELYEELGGEKITGIVKPFQKPYRALRVWDMGLAMAARHLQLDLSTAVVKAHQIELRGPGMKRVIPIDPDGRFTIDWSISAYDRRLTRESIESLLLQEQNRRRGASALLTNRWSDKLVFIGSTASGGNDLTDLGATPLEEETYLTSRFWNTANSLITGRFIAPTPLWIQLLLIFVMASGAGALTARLTPTSAVLAVVFGGMVYIVIVEQAYLLARVWLPMVAPLGAFAIAHFGVMAQQALAEQNERRRIKSVFGKIVSPVVMNELLGAENLALLGARRHVTISFADVRGFTELTDLSQAHAEEDVRRRKLTDQQAEDYFDAKSRELLQTVNLYLGLMSDVVKRHEGTLDKYIGDCVMAFWGAPRSNEQHALCAVRAAIDVQQAIHDLNHERAQQNRGREQENAPRIQRGEDPLPLLHLLSIGIGINTGIATVGVMGSDAHVYNYTVFGRDVNIASRLEGCAGGDKIIIGEGTYAELLHYAPELASHCIQLEPIVVRGIGMPVNIFEVRWQTAGLSSPIPFSLNPEPSGGSPDIPMRL